MDAATLEAILTSLDRGLTELKHVENCKHFAAEYNRLVEEVKKAFPKEDYVQSFTSIETVVTGKEGEADSQTEEKILEQVRMKTGLLKAYVSSEVAKQKKKTSVY